jgi:hypothetical protein
MLVGSLLTLASCGKSLSGKYEAVVLGTELTYEFGLFGKVTLTVDPIFGNDAVYEGKYEFNKDGDEITFTFEDEDAESYNNTVEFSSGEEDGVKYIKLDGFKYEKVD